MTLVARRPFTFNGKKFVPGTVIKETMLDSYQRETFLRTGIIVDRPERTKPVVVKSEPTEVKPLVKVETGE